MKVEEVSIPPESAAFGDEVRLEFVIENDEEEEKRVLFLVLDPDTGEKLFGRELRVGAGESKGVGCSFRMPDENLKIESKIICGEKTLYDKTFEVGLSGGAPLYPDLRHAKVSCEVEEFPKVKVVVRAENIGASGEAYLTISGLEENVTPDTTRMMVRAFSVAEWVVEGHLPKPKTQLKVEVGHYEGEEKVRDYTSILDVETSVPLATTIAFALGRRIAEPGEEVRFRGFLRHGDEPIPDADVIVLQKSDDTWLEVGKARTRSDGSFSGIIIAPFEEGLYYYRAEFPGSSEYKAGSSGTVLLEVVKRRERTKEEPVRLVDVIAEAARMTVEDLRKAIFGRRTRRSNIA